MYASVARRIMGTPGIGCVSFCGSTWIAGRVVLPGRQLTSRLPRTGTGTTTREHCRCPGHHDVPSSRLRPGRYRAAAGARGAGAAAETHGTPRHTATAWSIPEARPDRIAQVC